MEDHEDPTREAKRPPSGGDLGGQREMLERHVTRLASEIGPRNIYHYEALQAAAAFIETSLTEVGHAPTLQRYEARGQSFANIVAEITGERLQIPCNVAELKGARDKPLSKS